MKNELKPVKLNEVCDFQNGFAFKSNTYKERGLPIIRITNIQNDEIDMSELVFFDKKDYKVNLDRFRVYRGDLLIAMSGATTGKLGINNSDEEFYLNQRVGKFIPKKNLDKTFLYYFLTTKIEESLKIAAGAAQPNLSTEQINNFRIPLPAISEQKRIVSILDKSFAAIDKAKANTEKNLQNARELFESYLHEVFENEVFETKAIQDISKVVNGYAFSSKDFNSTNKLKSIKITNVGVGEFVEEDGNCLPEKFGKQNMDFMVKEGNIVIALTRSIISTGLKVALVPKNYDGALVNQRVAALIANENIINHKFLFNYLQTSVVSKYVLAHVNTLMQPNLSINDLKKLHVPCPSLNSQKKIVERLEKIKSEIQILENIFWKKVENLEEMKRSLLEKAFSGELN